MAKVIVKHGKHCKLKDLLKSWRQNGPANLLGENELISFFFWISTLK